MFEPFCRSVFLAFLVVLLDCFPAGAQPVVHKEEQGLSGMRLQEAKAFLPVASDTQRLEDTSSRSRQDAGGSKWRAIDSQGAGDSARMLLSLPEPAKNGARSLPDRTAGKGNVAWGVSTALTGIAATTFGLCYWNYHRSTAQQIQDKGIDPFDLGIAATLAIPVGVVMTCFGIAAMF